MEPSLINPPLDNMVIEYITPYSQSQNSLQRHLLSSKTLNVSFDIDKISYSNLSERERREMFIYEASKQLSNTLLGQMKINVVQTPNPFEKDKIIFSIKTLEDADRKILDEYIEKYKKLLDENKQLSEKYTTNNDKLLEYIEKYNELLISHNEILQKNKQLENIKYPWWKRFKYLFLSRF